MSLYITCLYFTCILIVVFLGVNVLITKIKTLSGLYFFLFCFATVLWMFFLYLGGFYAPIGKLVIDSEKALFFFRLAFATPAFMLPSMLLFFFNYPKAQKMSVVLKFLIALSVIFILIISLTPLVHKALIIENGIYVADEFGAFFVIWLILFQGYLVGILILVLLKTLKAHGIEKRKLSMAMIGFVFFEFSASLTNTILPLFDIYVFQNESILFTLFFAIPAFYSMQKYRFFHLSIVSLNILRKIILFSFIILIGLIFGYFLQKFFPQGALLVNITILVVGVFIYQKLEKIFPELVPQGLREFRAIIGELSYQSMFYDSYQSLISALEEAFVIKQNISKVNLLLIRDKKSKMDIPVYVKNTFVDYLESQKVDILVAEEIPFLDFPMEEQAMILKAFQELDVAVCIPLFSHKTVIGLFVLGNKENNESYSEEEIESLLKLKNSLEICFMNILLKLNLKEENNLMKATILEKTKQIKKQYNKIKELLAQQSSFIAVTAHEFRTPLSIALFQVQEMLETGKNLKVADLKTVEKSLENLKKLTQNLFSVQQYDLNKIELHAEKTDLLEFLQNSFEHCKKLTAPKQIHCSFKNDLKKKVFCKIDKQQILQVLHNILTNAIKFTPEKGKIYINLSQNSEGVLIKIADTGKGVADKNKTRIFEKFQTEKITSSTGIGLGLYICKKIIDLHQGKIWVEDAPGGGAVFCVMLKAL